MASASKKSSPPIRTTKKPRYSQAEASLRMLNATTELLLQFPPADVTVLRICEKAGVHTDYVVRYFGSREELMCQSIEAAFLAIFNASGGGGTTRRNLAIDDSGEISRLIQARFRTITYLLGCGVSPERFKAGQKMAIQAVLARSVVTNVTDRTKTNLVLLGLLIVQGISTFGEVNDMTDRQRHDLLALVENLSTVGATLESTLGWDAPKAKPKKRK